MGRLHDALRAGPRGARSQTRRAKRHYHRGLVCCRRHHPTLAVHGLHSARLALVWSVLVTLVALGVFGYIKGRFTGARPARSASQTVVIGGLAAGAAFLLAKLIS